MNKKGFTLLELIGVIILISLITLIALPRIINSVRSNQDNVDEVTFKLTLTATKLYMDEYAKDYPKYDGASYCITLTQLVENKNLKDKITSNGIDITDKKSVQATYEDGFNYSLVDNKECIVSNPVCTFIDEEIEKEYNLGEEYICEVKDNVKYTFYLLSKNKNKVSLILDSNINTSGVINDPSKTYDLNLIEWNNDITSGPVTIMNNLYTITKTWDNIPNIDLNITDAIGKFSIITNGELTDIIKDDNLVSSSYKNLKARLATKEELENIGCRSTSSSCPSYIYNYLNNISNNNGYWILDSKSENETYYISKDGSIATNTINSKYGIRPVIEIPKSMID